MSAVVTVVTVVTVLLAVLLLVLVVVVVVLVVSFVVGGVVVAVAVVVVALLLLLLVVVVIMTMIKLMMMSMMKKKLMCVLCIQPDVLALIPDTCTPVVPDDDEHDDAAAPCPRQQRCLFISSFTAFPSTIPPPFPCNPAGLPSGGLVDWTAVVVSFHRLIVFMCCGQFPLPNCLHVFPPPSTLPLSRASHRLVVCLHCTALSCASTASLVPLWCLKRWAAPPEHRTASSSPSRSPTQVTAFPLSCHRLYPGRPLPFFCHATPLLAVSPSSVTAFHCHATASACGVAF